MFDPASGRWKMLEVLLPTQRVSHDCAVQPDGTILAIGGADPSVQMFMPTVDALMIQPRDLR
ncbi:hypothetical protein GCM10009777_40060 [Microbacterium pumilum]|uniref:Galactose oxidase n=1 Tax=Microbacterium pumilum TaxID=344165 RepID=A0ABN2T4U8_9MICO